MRQKSFLFLKFFFIFLISLIFIHCGSSPVLSTPSSGDSGSSDTDSTSASDSTAVMSIQEFGDNDNAPTNSVLTSLNVILDCTDKDTSDPDTDYVSVTCTVGSTSIVYDYSCADGITQRENEDDATDTAELFEDISVTCSSSSSAPTLTEAELIVS